VKDGRSKARKRSVNIRKGKESYQQWDGDKNKE